MPLCCSQDLAPAEFLLVKVEMLLAQFLYRLLQNFLYQLKYWLCSFTMCRNNYIININKYSIN